MKRFCLLIIAVIVVGAPIWSQPARMLNLELDLANFRYNEESNYLEVYYSLQRKLLTYIHEGTGYTGSAIVRAELLERGGGDPLMRVWRVPVTVTDTASLTEQSLVGKVSFVIEPGVYQLTMIATDEANSARSDTSRIVFESEKYSFMKPVFSDIELCSSIRRMERDTANIFYKNTLEVVPNPSRVYAVSTPVLMYYLELYNAPSEQYMIRTEVINAYGKTVIEKKKEKQGSARPDGSTAPTGVVDIGTIPIHTYPSNLYTLAVTLMDTSGTSITSQTKRFYIYNPGVAQDSSVYELRPIDQVLPDLTGLPEDELDREFGQARYIAEPSEKQQWEELRGSEAKKLFLSRFWNMRDPDPLTPINEARKEFTTRVGIVNEEFRTAYREGWQTDRGRVYIQYGKPDAIERFSSEADTKPYQIWTYDYIEGGVQFVFVDRFGFNNYELVHSTMRNELHDENWKRFIRATH